jgi:diaminopropionate ammonia-lyase
MSDRPMRFRINRFRDRSVVPQSGREAIRAFHASLPGYSPTPLISLPGLAHSLGLGAVLLKDEGQRFGLKAFKSLGASWAVHRLRQSGVTLSTVSAATEGNHGRAVAWTARQLGLRAVIFMTNRASPLRVAAIAGEGAEVCLVDGTYEDAVTTCAEQSALHGWQVVADVGYDDYLEIPRWITAGYSTIFGECAEQLESQGLPEPDVIIVQAGVGGFAAAAAEYVRQQSRQPKLVIVEPVEADPLLESASSPDGVPTDSSGAQQTLMAGLNCSRLSLSAWPVLKQGVDLFLTIRDDWAIDAMRRLAHPVPGDGSVVAGESGAAGLAGLLALMEHPPFLPAREHLGLGPGSTILLMVTEADTDPVSWRRLTQAKDLGLRNP